MKAKLLSFLVLVVIVCTMNACSTSTSNTPTSVVSSQKKASYIYSTAELDAMNIINNYRVSVGLKTLTQINYISLVSEKHDSIMIATNTVGHDGFVARSEDIMNVLGAINVGENIAYNYNTPEAALNAWLNSPSHKQIIEGDYTNFGLAIRLSPDGKTYYTNIFVKI